MRPSAVSISGFSPCIRRDRLAPLLRRSAQSRARASLLSVAQQPAYDILITERARPRRIGQPVVCADVAISADRIAAVGRLDGATAARVDRRGGSGCRARIHRRALARGRGLDGALHTAVPLLAQGITTVFINPDGGGPTDLDSQRKALETRGVGVNVAQFVPHGSIRGAVLGMADRAPNAGELAQMAALVRTGMEAGGLGLSSGLYYAPGSYAKTEEVIALAKVASEFGGVYSSHIRDEADYSIGVVARCRRSSASRRRRTCPASSRT